jgi:glycosyltransferase involved in cell wall biosynthesis
MLEAMAAGVPVVATAVGGIPEAIKDGITGLLAPPRNPVKLAEAISRVINDMQLAGTIRSQARLMIRKEYDSRVMADKYAELYARIAGRI